MAGRPRVTVVGLGPAGPDLMTAATIAAIDAVPHRFLRTGRHPAAVACPGSTFDHHYEAAASMDSVYAAIVDDLVVAAARHGHVLYAVPGSPAVAERSVELLRADARVDVDVVPALSCVDLAWVRLGVDPLAAGARIVDGHRFAIEAAGVDGPLLVLQCDRASVLADIKLAPDPDADPAEVTVLQRLGLADERIATIPWHELDRVEADHLTSLYIDTGLSVGRELVRFAQLVRTLRAECPWDAEQTHATLRRYLLEEAYEVIDAIDRDDSEHLEEELGDLLFQVFFHATLGAEAGQFELADVARGIHDKLVGRHPHVFGGDPEAWDDIKRREKGRDGALDGVPDAFPALMYAEKLQRRAAGVGFDWPDVEGAWPKVLEEIAELRAAAVDGREEEVGDLLFACVNVARHLGIDAELALRAAARKFKTRFEAVERMAREQGLAMPGTDLAVLDALWDQAKR